MNILHDCSTYNLLIFQLYYIIYILRSQDKINKYFIILFNKLSLIQCCDISNIHEIL